VNIPISIFYILILLWISLWINKKYIKELPKTTLPIMFIIKLLFAGVFIYIYTYYYGDGELSEDSADFLHDSKVLFDLFFQSPSDFFQIFFDINRDTNYLEHHLSETSKWLGGNHLIYNDTKNIIRINTLFYFFSFGTFYTHFILFSFISLMGALELFQWIKTKTTLPLLFVLLLLVAIPGISVWGSSNLKEPMIILGLALFFRGMFDKEVRNRRLRVVSGAILLLLFKSYIFVVCILVVILVLFFKTFKKTALSLITFSTFGLILFLTFSNTITNIISNKQADFMNVAKGGLYLYGDDENFYYIPIESTHLLTFKNENYVLIEKPVEAYAMKKNERIERVPILLNEIGVQYKIHLNMVGAKSELNYTLINGSTKQLLLNIPESLRITFLEPIPTKNSSNLQYYSFFENILYILMFLIGVYSVIKNKIKEQEIFFSLMFYMLILSIGMGWVTTISGAIVRYMIPVHLMIVVFFIYFFRFNWKSKANL